MAGLSASEAIPRMATGGERDAGEMLLLELVGAGWPFAGEHLTHSALALFIESETCYGCGLHSVQPS